jgi:hypothetical protein
LLGDLLKTLLGDLLRTLLGDLLRTLLGDLFSILLGLFVIMLEGGRGRVFYFEKGSLEYGWKYDLLVFFFRGKEAS